MSDTSAAVKVTGAFDPETGETHMQQAAKPVAEAKPDDGITVVNVTGSTDDKKMETELTFTMEWTNDETGKKLVGTFTAERPNIGMVQQIAVIKARLNGGERVPVDIDFMNEMMAYCSVVLTDTPKWWTPEKFYTASPLRKVWDHVRSWENSFRKQRVV